MIDRFLNRLVMVIQRGRLKTVDDTGVIQTSQIDLGPKDGSGSPLLLRDKTPTLNVFGVTSSPPPGSDAIVLFLGGDHDKGVIIAHGHQQYRMRNLEPGDTAIHDIRGAYLWLKAAGPVLDAATGDVVVQNAGNISLTGTKLITITAGSDGITIDAGGGPLQIQNATDITLDFSGALIINGDVQVNGALAVSGDVVAGAVSLESHVHGGVTVGAGNTAGPH